MALKRRPASATAFNQAGSDRSVHQIIVRGTGVAVEVGGAAVGTIVGSAVATALGAANGDGDCTGTEVAVTVARGGTGVRIDGEHAARARLARAPPNRPSTWRRLAVDGRRILLMRTLLTPAFGRASAIAYNVGWLLAICPSRVLPASKR
jgi:hypothetical protein